MRYKNVIICCAHFKDNYIRVNSFEDRSIKLFWNFLKDSSSVPVSEILSSKGQFHFHVYFQQSILLIIKACAPYNMSKEVGH